MNKKVRLIRQTDQIMGDSNELKVNGIYTISNYEPGGHRITIVEGRHNNCGGWFYNPEDFEFVITEINKNIRVL